MSDEQGPTGNAQPDEEQAQEAQSEGSHDQAAAEGGSWDEVTHALEDFGHAVSSWAAALKEDPETRRHARQLKEGFEQLGSELGVTLDSAAKSDFGQSVSGAAGRAGAAVSDAARKTGDQVAPVIIAALRTAADGIQRAEDTIEKRSAAAPASEGEVTDAVPGDEQTAEAETAPEPPNEAGTPSESSAEE